jgi:hypothetical protein
MSTMKIMFRVSALLGLAACAPTFAVAQAEPDTVHLRSNCRLAAQVISTGHPAPRREWALGIIPRCRDGGPALAQALRAHRTSTSVESLNSLTWPTIRLRDGQVFSVAMEIAADRSASTPARVFAIRTLMWAMSPGGGIDYAELIAPPERQRSCGYGPSTHTAVTQGAPLPADYVARSKALANNLVRDSTEEFSVRRAAVCLAYLQPWAGLIAK